MLALSLAGNLKRIKLGPARCSELDMSFEGIEIHRVVPRRRCLTRLVVKALAIGWRHRPVANYGRYDRLGIAAIGGSAAARKAEHRRVGVVVRNGNTVGKAQRDVVVDRRCLNGAMWQTRSWRGLPRVDWLSRRRCIANQFLAIERRCPDYWIRQINRRFCF